LAGAITILQYSKYVAEPDAALILDFNISLKFIPPWMSPYSKEHFKRTDRENQHIPEPKQGKAQ
jgi:hypothetical protein